MIIIINGSVGSGKSSVSWELQERFEKSVMLDGDYIGAVHPFEIYDEQRIEYLYETLLNLIEFHHSNGYNDFVINYVFEDPESLTSLCSRLKTVIPEIRVFRLSCSTEEQKKRIQKRSTDQVDWELKRFLELNDIQEKAAQKGFIGEEIVTDGKTVVEVADEIVGKIQKPHIF